MKISELIEHVQTPNKISGFEKFEELFGPIYEGSIFTIAAAPGIGKSVTTKYVAMNLSNYYKVGYLSCENKPEQDKRTFLNLMETTQYNDDNLIYMNMDDFPDPVPDPDDPNTIYIPRVQAVKSLFKEGIKVLVIDSPDFLLDENKGERLDQFLDLTRWFRHLMHHSQLKLLVTTWQLNRDAMHECVSNLTSKSISDTIDIVRKSQKVLLIAPGLPKYEGTLPADMANALSGIITKDSYTSGTCDIPRTIRSETGEWLI